MWNAIKGNGKQIKVKSFLCLTEHYAMKGNGGVDV
jgi:hypothetical protein